MASRRNNLFSGYDAAAAASRAKSSPGPSSYSPSPYSAGQSSSAYGGGASEGYRAATPNRKGQYSDAVLSELENQNEQQLDGMSAKVAMLKSITVAIGDEIRDSTALAEKMNDTFDNTRVRLRGTMNRMLRMAEKTGVSWKVWLLFFGAVIFVFLYVKWS